MIGKPARWLAAVPLLAALAFAGQAASAPLPKKVGRCSDTRVALIGYRLEGAPDSGSSIAYANGGFQISYDVLPGIGHSRRGDPVRLCLVSVPQDCPKGDDRGRIYRATNLRTGESWEAPDAEHSCGGA